jgi:hypothetical protein
MLGGEGYRLGRLFALFLFVFALFQVVKGLGGDDFSPVEIGWSVVVGIAALWLRPLAWHTLLVALVVHFVLRLGWLIVAFHPLALLGIAFDAYLFAYFYQRRVLFGRARRWTWLETVVPPIVGSDLIPPLRAQTVEPPSPGVLGLSRRTTILVVVGLMFLLLIAYQLVGQR